MPTTTSPSKLMHSPESSPIRSVKIHSTTNSGNNSFDGIKSIHSKSQPLFRESTTTPFNSKQEQLVHYLSPKSLLDRTEFDDQSEHSCELNSVPHRSSSFLVQHGQQIFHSQQQQQEVQHVELNSTSMLQEGDNSKDEMVIDAKVNHSSSLVTNIVLEHSTRKRRKPCPIRSMKRSELLQQLKTLNENCDDEVEREHRLRQGIIKLDVYSLYLASPKQLLYFGRKTCSNTRASLNGLHSRLSSYTNTTSSSCNGNENSYTYNGGSTNSNNVNGSTPGSGRKRRQTSKTSYFKESILDETSSSFISRSNSPAGADNGKTNKSLFRGQKALPEEIEETKAIDLSRFNYTVGAPTVQWKGTPLDIPKSSKSYDELTREEIQTCRILRILPAQYLHIKQVMLQQILKAHFKKRDAQAWFRIDVNKTNRLYDWFCALGWIPSREEWEERIPEIFGL